MTAEYPEIILAPDAGRKVSALGVDMVFKAVSAETGGSYFCMEYLAPQGWAGPPKHLHSKTDEVFYVLEGEITLYLDDRVVKGEPGAFVQVPRGTAHTFANFGDAPAKYLIFIVHGGFEGYFEELPRVVEEHGYPPPPEIVEELGKKYDFKNVGPRPTPPN